MISPILRRLEPLNPGLPEMERADTEREQADTMTTPATLPGQSVGRGAVGGTLVGLLRERLDTQAVQANAEFTRVMEHGPQREVNRGAWLGQSPLSGTGPGTNAFNDETRGLRRVASLLRRGARQARLSGDYEKAAELTQRALDSGMGGSLMGAGQTNRNMATLVRAGYETAARLSNPIIPGQEQPGAAEGGAMGRSPRRLPI